MSPYDGKIQPSSLGEGCLEAYLPNLYATSHAANLLELDNGDILCTWFSGSGEGNPDTNIVMSRLPFGADRWTVPMDLSGDPERSEQNPVLFLAPDGEIWLFHTSNEPHNQKTSRICVRKSRDDGYTWGPPAVLFRKPGIFIRQPCVVLSNGDWLLPAYYCTWNGDYSVVKISSDRGKNWKEYPVAGSTDRVQMDVVELGDKALFAIFRSRIADRIYISFSKDGGHTWSVPQKSGLPNNNSSIQMARLANGHIVVAYNDSTLERDQFRVREKDGKLSKKPLRTPLTLAVSEDGGKTWPHTRNVQMADEEYLISEIGYSYPSVMQTQNGRIHAAYSFLRKGIKYVAFNENWVTR